MRKFIITLVIVAFGLLVPGAAYAADVPLGVHLLDPQELEYILPYRSDSTRFFVTVPLSMNDRRVDVWEKFFETCFKTGITPLVRWVTEFEGNSWKVPTRKQIVDATYFLNTVNWPGRRIVILWNEPNHAKEWGGNLDPENYADIASFAAGWLKTERVSYEVLPAGLDLAAPNGSDTMDSMRYIERMHAARPELFELIDGWTSHSYPNPDFSSTPYRTGKNSLRGFELELNKLKSLTGRDFSVYITETGWRSTRLTSRLLPSYYKYAATHIWSKPEVHAVTVFLLRGFNGPYAEFSLLNSANEPTVQMKALLDAKKAADASIKN